MRAIVISPAAPSIETVDLGTPDDSGGIVADDNLRDARGPRRRIRYL